MTPWAAVALGFSGLEFRILSAPRALSNCSSLEGEFGDAGLVEFTEAEWAELEAVFPEGVCDWTKPDAHAEGYQGTWLSFGPSEVNRAR